MPPPVVYRIHYGTYPLTLRDWSAATASNRLGKQTFGHRWDDPEREFRLLYTASTKVGACIEVLQDLRPKVSELARLQRIERQADEELPDFGVLPDSYFGHLHGCELGIVTTKPFLDVVDAAIVQTMRMELAALATQLELEEVDVSTMTGHVREFTQAVARRVYEAGYAGISSPSSLGSPYTNWSIFEDGYLTNRLRVEATLLKAPVPIAFDDNDLVDALNTLGLRIEGQERLLRYAPEPIEQADQPT
jgi:hypothetical protein